MRENRFRKLLNQDGPIFGGGGTDPAVIEMLGHWGFDYAFIDTEHTTLNVGYRLEELVRAADSVGLPVVVRLQGLDEHLIRNTLEMGVDGVVLPHTRTREDAERAAKYARFPPQGVRGSSAVVRASNYGAGPGFNWKEFVKKTNEDVVVIGMAEDQAFFDNIDEILDVDGLSMINYGPTDLASDLGLNLLYDLDNPAIKGALETLIAKASARKIPVMCPGAPRTLERARQLVNDGVKAINLMSPLKAINNECQRVSENIMAPLRETK